MGWDVLKILEWYCEAYNMKVADIFIQTKLAVMSRM